MDTTKVSEGLCIIHAYCQPAGRGIQSILQCGILSSYECKYICGKLPNIYQPYQFDLSQGHRSNTVNYFAFVASKIHKSSLPGNSWAICTIIISSKPPLNLSRIKLQLSIWSGMAICAKPITSKTLVTLSIYLIVCIICVVGVFLSPILKTDCLGQWSVARKFTRTTLLVQVNTCNHAALSNIRSVCAHS